MCRVLKFSSYWTMTVAGVYPKAKYLTKDDVNYSYYLGKDYMKDYKAPKGIVPTIISPHCSSFDIQALATALDGNITFAAGAFLKDIPFLAGIAELLGCVFVPRNGSK